MQDGVYVKTGALTRRYLGTVRARTATAIEDSWFAFNTSLTEARRWVWNAYNRVGAGCVSFDATSHTYNSTTNREWNAGTNARRISWVRGLPMHDTTISITQSGNTNSRAAIGIDSGTLILPGSLASVTNNVTTSTINITALATEMGTAPGFHSAVPVESAGTGTANFVNYTMVMRTSY
jgi:hypothetical protein